MKIIYPNIVTFYDANAPLGTVPGFPLGNLVNSHILKCWKAEHAAPFPQTERFFTCKAEGAQDSFALFGLEADEVEIQIYKTQADLEAGANLVESFTKSLKPSNPFGETYLRQVWFDLTPSSSIQYFKVILKKLTGSLNEVKAGVVCIGQAKSYPNPTWSSSQRLQNHSLLKEMKNGSTYRLKKPISKKLNLTLELPTKENGRQTFYEFIQFYEMANCQAFAVIWAEGLRDSAGNSLDDQHLLWGAMDNDFTPTEGKYSLSTIDFSMTEEL